MDEYYPLDSPILATTSLVGLGRLERQETPLASGHTRHRKERFHSEGERGTGQVRSGLGIARIVPKGITVSPVL
jgi:hypothetical protein